MAEAAAGKGGIIAEPERSPGHGPATIPLFLVAPAQAGAHPSSQCDGSGVTRGRFGVQDAGPLRPAGRGAASPSGEVGGFLDRASIGAYAPPTGLVPGGALRTPDGAQVEE